MNSVFLILIMLRFLIALYSLDLHIYYRFEVCFHIFSMEISCLNSSLKSVLKSIYESYKLFESYLLIRIRTKIKSIGRI